MQAFADLGLSDDVLKALSDIGYEKPSPVQEQALPVLLSGVDVIGQAQTGSGKTAAFGIPLVEGIDVSNPEVQALVLTPTRELCIQVTQAIRSFGARKGVEVVATFGGAPIADQISRLRSKSHVVVGTVGRVEDLLKRGALQLGSCRYVVLDEADEMLDLGFIEDVEKILRRTPNSRQTALFSATMAPPIRALADNYMYHPETVKIKAPTLTVDTVKQFGETVASKDKQDKLVEFIKSERPEQAIVFTRTKLRCDQLFRHLRDKNENVKALHGDMSQGQRDGVMLSFKNNRVPILIATDVAARGLDVSTVSHVINFDAPNSPDTYVHRIGRTGRAGASGRAITFFEPKQQSLREAIEQHISTELAAWEPGGDAAAVAVEEKPRRHRKPRIQRSDTAKMTRLVLVPGACGGKVQVRDLVKTVREASGLDGEGIQDVNVFDQFSLISVPTDEVDAVLDALGNKSLGGKRISIQRLVGLTEQVIFSCGYSTHKSRQSDSDRAFL